MQAVCSSDMEYYHSKVSHFKSRFNNEVQKGNCILRMFSYSLDSLNRVDVRMIEGLSSDA